MRRLLAVIMVFLVIANFLPAPICAQEQGKGKLERIEDQLDQPKEQKDDREEDHDRHRHHDHDDHHSDLSAGDVAALGFLDVFMDFLLSGLMTTGSEGMAELYRDLKLGWHPALPTIRVEGDYQYAAGGIHGFSGKAEAGYLTFGADAEYLRYFESNASDLSIVSGHALLRSLFAKVFGANLALGVKSFIGKGRHTGFEIGLPLYLFISKNFILDVLPYMAFINGKNIYDVAGGFSFKYKFVGVRAAYRAMFINDETLHGPQVGLFFQW